MLEPPSSSEASLVVDASAEPVPSCSAEWLLETNTDESNGDDQIQQTFLLGRSSTEGDLDSHGVSARARNEIASFARRFSQLSCLEPFDSDPINPFLDPNSDLELDPNSGFFSPTKWVKSLLQIASRDPERYPHRTAGVSFRRLSVYGYGTAADYQMTVANLWFKAISWLVRLLGLRKRRQIDILHDFEGLVRSGEMLVVLGRPGSGCSTFLRTLAGETHGVWLDPKTDIQYQGISWGEMHTRFQGEVIYQAETETHFPQLTAGDTLLFAAYARAPSNRFPGVSRDQYARHMRDVAMAVFGLSHTTNTKVGNELIRGVSGGERKRISIAETSLCACPVQCWDNSTRGLDSSTALEFVRTLRTSTRYTGSTAIVSIYQAGQAIYDLFDKAIVLYEGREIYFGNAVDAKRFFVGMGFYCPERQTTADFLTSLTNPAERRVQPGFEHRVPRTSDEFTDRWKASPERRALLVEIKAYQTEYPLGSAKKTEFESSRRAQKAKGTRARSSYTLSYLMQIRLCLWRAFRRLMNDLSLTFISIFINIITGLIVASVFFNLQPTTDSFFHRGSLLFLAVLLNAFASSLEILTLWEQRPIVEKHQKYALYHPSAEAISSMLVDFPGKIVSAIASNTILYFMANLHRTPEHFFIFLLFSFSTTLTMSNLFRAIGAISRTLAQSMPPASILMLALVIYTGFTIPVINMHPWFRWINYANPIAYAFEALMINEFSGRQFACSTYVPSGEEYKNLPPGSSICGGTGAIAGQNFISGDSYINTSFQYHRSHLWRNFWILVAFFFAFLVLYITASEFVTAKPSKGEVLVFPRNKIPAFAGKEVIKCHDPEKGVKTSLQENATVSSENLNQSPAIMKQSAIFHWQDVCYDIKIKGHPRRILDRVDGWIRPGTLTALMGVSGAGKTTLLDVLANRVTVGVVTGQVFVDGRPRDDSFQRKTGYVQQHDLHLETSTVREALRFSALLRQPASTSRAKKLAYVEEVIKMLDMQGYAEAVVGVVGEGLNVEQRKRLTIGVEIAAKPELLLFLDEPTSGLDSQTSWSICNLMRKLANHGQAILCTIHQPSAILMQEFDRLLFLAEGGKTIYFGELGRNMEKLIEYFEKKGSLKCPSSANPAEWMMDVIGAAPRSRADRDWAEVWKSGPERAQVRKELAKMKMRLGQTPRVPSRTNYNAFAMPLWYQSLLCLHRIAQQYWRTPGYIYSKVALSTIPALFIGLSFWKEPNSLQGLQNQMFSIFMLLSIFPNLVQQMMPYFVTQRALYEVRERPSRTYSWKAFMMASIFVESFWNILMAGPMFACWYYPPGLYNNAVSSNTGTQRSGTMFLIVAAYMLFMSTFGSMMIAGIEHAESAANLAQLFFSLSLIFCGILAGPTVLPSFWIFMYRISPFTYLVSAVLSTGLSGTKIECSTVELLHLSPPSNETCDSFLRPYINRVGGFLVNPDAAFDCQYCPMSSTDQYLSTLGVYYSDRWRNIGIIFAYIGFNIAAAVFLYWLARVPKKRTLREK